MFLLKFIAFLLSCFSRFCNFLSHFALLAVRYYICFDVFLKSGLVKYHSWQTTLQLFQNEYKLSWLPLPPPIVEKYSLNLPAMPYDVAAYMGTFAEIALPLLVLIGLGGRLPIFALFIFNYVAAVSYPFLWTADGAIGLQQHFLWGSLLAWLVFSGSGRISCDAIFHSICRRYRY